MNIRCKTLFNNCSYFASKYVTSCDQEICSSVALLPQLVKFESGRIVGVKLIFTVVAGKTIDVTDGTPCGDGSWCHKKKCTKSSDEKLLSYSKKEKIDGGWSEHSLSRNCMSPLDNKEDSTVNWVKYLQMIKCDKNCSFPNLIQFRSCTNPVPSLGGKPCWKTVADDGSLRMIEWSFSFAPSCAKCANYESRDFHARTKCSSFHRDVCMFYGFDGIVNGEVVTDFRKCFDLKRLLLKNDVEFARGRCFIGNCMPLFET